MKYWKDGKIHDTELEDSFPVEDQEWELMQSIATKQEFEIIDVNGFPTFSPKGERERQSRSFRDALIREATWRRERHNDEVLLGLEPTEPLLPIVEYLQALRDVPQQEGFPEDIEWPIPPWESIESVDTTEIEGEA